MKHQELDRLANSAIKAAFPELQNPKSTTFINLKNMWIVGFSVGLLEGKTVDNTTKEDDAKLYGPIASGEIDLPKRDVSFDEFNDNITGMHNGAADSDLNNLNQALRKGSGWVGGDPKPGTVFTKVAGPLDEDYQPLDPPLQVQPNGSLKPVNETPWDTQTR
jgi:hypothetical protein